MIANQESGLKAAFSCPEATGNTAKTGSKPICHSPILTCAFAIFSSQKGP
jgi:hypothetical protein